MAITTKREALGYIKNRATNAALQAVVKAANLRLKKNNAKQTPKAGYMYSNSQGHHFNNGSIRNSPNANY